MENINVKQRSIILLRKTKYDDFNELNFNNVKSKEKIPEEKENNIPQI